MWAVVLELDDQEPALVSEHRRREDAISVGEELARLHRHTGGKVTISQPDSADQLQRYGRQRFHRQQPELAATGQDLTVLVPRITLSAEELRRWQR